MQNYDNDLLIQNIRRLMSDKGITQQQLADILGMSQSNVSKALSDSDKKCFTLDQVIGIAKHFGVSIDSLVGNNTAKEHDLSPRSIAAYFAQLIEHGDVSVFFHPVEEDIYEPTFDPQSGMMDYTHEKTEVSYPAFYFPAYWYIPDGLSYEEESELHAEMTQCGNDNQHLQTNKFFSRFLEIHKLFKQKALTEETYRTVVNDLLSHLKD